MPVPDESNLTNGSHERVPYDGLFMADLFLWKKFWPSDKSSLKEKKI